LLRCQGASPTQPYLTFIQAISKIELKHSAADKLEKNG